MAEAITVIAKVCSNFGCVDILLYSFSAIPTMYCELSPH